MKFKTFIVIAVLCALCLAGCGSQEAAPSAGEETKPVDIKITTVQMDTQQMGVAVGRIRELAEEKLGDKVNIIPYTGAQLYSGVEELEAIKKGDVHICLAIGSAMGSLDPSMSIFKLPYLFPTEEVAYEVLDGPIGDEVFKNISAQGIKVLGGFSSGSIFISSSKRPLVMPKDFQGLKMRTSGKMEAAIIEALGAISVVLPSEETYSGLQQGVADGLATPSTVFYARKYHEVQDYITNAGIVYWSNGFILSNNDFWQGMPDDVRTGMQEVITQVLQETRDKCQADVQGTIDKIEEAGKEVHNMTPEQIKAWQEETQSVYEEYEDTIGAELIKTVKNKVDEITG